MYWILWILGGAALLYYVACVRYAGRKASYLWIWLAAGIVLTLSGGGLYLLDCRGIVLPVWFMAAAAGSAAAVLLLFGILLVWIGKGMPGTALSRSGCVGSAGSKGQRDKTQPGAGTAA